MDKAVDLLKANVFFPGDLSYVLFKFLVSQRQRWSEWCMFKGATEMAFDEFYRRHIAPYEESRMKKNGDVE